MGLLSQMVLSLLVVTVDERWVHKVSSVATNGRALGPLARAAGALGAAIQNLAHGRVGAAAGHRRGPCRS
jgi:hypothetical protein